MRRPRANPRANQTTGALSNVKHYARITEVVNFTPPTANADFNYAFSLNLFDRAVALSKNFKFYRAKRVVWTYLPDFITFQAGGASTLPQVSMLMNRTGDSTLWTSAEYDAQGAVPKPFNKKMVIAYNPNIVQSIQYIANPAPGGAPFPYVGNIGARPVYNEWIATGTYTRSVTYPNNGVNLDETNNNMLYQGHSMIWEVTTAGSAPLGTAYCEVEWEFKDPLFVTPPSDSTLVQSPGSAPPPCSPAPSVL